MTQEVTPDPVVLVAGPKRQPQAYRCPECRAVETHAGSLPTGGTECRRCGARITTVDVVAYASLRTRTLALLVDIVVAGLPTFLIMSFYGWLAVAYAPKDAGGDDLTFKARVWITIGYAGIGATLMTMYYLVGNALGRTVGKRAMSLRIVNVGTGDQPGLGGAIARTLAQVLTLATLGVRYGICVFDARRRTLHDRIANTMVVDT